MVPLVLLLINMWEMVMSVEQVVSVVRDNTGEWEVGCSRERTQ